VYWFVGYDLCFSLSNNEIGDEGAKYLAKGLQSNTTLITLRLDNNRITDAGMQDINDVMVRNNRLKFISILHERDSIEYVVMLHFISME
jgi:hypothetical protein